MINFSLAISKMMKNSKIMKKLDKNIYYKIKYPENRIMIIDDNLDFSLLNSLFGLTDYKFNLINLNNDDDLYNFIIKYSDNKGNINSDYLFFKVKNNDIKKYGSIIKPDYILIGETSDIIGSETKELFDKTNTICSNKYDYEGIKYSIQEKSDYYISNIDYIREKIMINDQFSININETSEYYLKEIIMFFTLFMVLNLDINIFDIVNNKSFYSENKKIFMDISNNNFNDAIKFISRYNDYKAIVIGWKNLYEDISWLYNVEFERLKNKNIQKIYCIGTNAFDVATRLKYADLSEKLIVPSSNIDVVLKEIKSYNLDLYVLTDSYYIDIIKGVKK